jgi:hypothetical protein
MNEIELKWATADGGKKFITTEGINMDFEIDENNKEIKNAKAFFREIIYMSFLNDTYKKIVLVDDTDNELSEVKTIINELIHVCNDELEARSTAD